MVKNLKSKSYARMNLSQLRQATREFDREFVPTRPLTVRDNAKHRQAQVGRPKIGKGSQVVPISIERGLLEKADAFARRHNLRRSQMVAEGLRLLLQRRAS
jgi:hypothetical protein